MGIWEVQTYMVIRGKEDEHNEIITKVGANVLKTGRKYLYFDRLHGPMNTKVLVISYDNLADMEEFETDWWNDKELEVIGNQWMACVDFNSYQQTFWKENPV